MKTTSKTKNIFSTKMVGTILTALFLMFGTTAFAQEIDEVENERLGNTEVGEFNDWDTDTDAQWNEDEYNTFVEDTGLYGDWDTNNDGLYNDDELSTGFFNQSDADGDGFLSNDEYARGNSAWEREYGDHFDSWDANDDNLLDAEEYANGVNDTGVYGDWDTDNDGAYTTEEVNSGLFGTYDGDDDGFISNDEYNEVGFGSQPRE